MAEVTRHNSKKRPEKVCIRQKSEREDLYLHFKPTHKKLSPSERLSQYYPNSLPAMNRYLLATSRIMSLGGIL